MMSVDPYFLFKKEKQNILLLFHNKRGSLLVLINLLVAVSELLLYPFADTVWIQTVPANGYIFSNTEQQSSIQSWSAERKCPFASTV